MGQEISLSKVNYRYSSCNNAALRSKSDLEIFVKNEIPRSFTDRMYFRPRKTNLDFSPKYGPEPD